MTPDPHYRHYSHYGHYMALCSTLEWAQGLLMNARKATSKVTVIDVSVFIGPTEEDFLLGAISYFNDSDTPVKFEDGIYYCQIRTVKREEGFQVHSGNPERYSFVGDLKTPIWIFPYFSYLEVHEYAPFVPKNTF
ncbi:hypothetical protein B0H13DRAFT_1900338 [Mycena leptocephala]|nr:hypothetical protein B0H13DRAFT_1900338 [Mycena leptocephala]